MKANLLLAVSVFLITAVACRRDAAESADTVPVQELPVAARQQGQHLALDSFQRTVITGLPAGKPAKRSFKNSFAVHRDKDSVTVSGAVFAEGENKTLTAYRFYFKTSGKYCYAYLQQQYFDKAGAGGIQQFKSREAGYCLRLTETVAG